MPNDRPHTLAWLDEELGKLEQATLRRRLTVRSSPQSAHVRIDDQELINFGSNDYLGLSTDPRLLEAARAAAEREGWGTGSSPLVSGRSDSHATLERDLAEFEGTEAALVFSSGFAANGGIIPALVDRHDAIFGDAKNHASLIDGCRLSHAKRFVYPHGDCEALEEMLRQRRVFRRRLIVTDSLFSMDGEFAPLVRLGELAERYDAMLMVDEAHATGVLGAGGRGVVELLAAECPELHDRVSVRMGTMSHALGSAGGFVCGRQSLVDWLANRARTYVFSTAQPPAASAAASVALRIVRDEPERRRLLQKRAADLRRRLREDGWNTGASRSQIVPVVVGTAEKVMQLTTALREAGLFVPGIRPPSVPDGEASLRISVCCFHTPEMVDRLVAALDKQR